MFLPPLKKAKNIPSKGTNYSHRGNTSFPVRERFIPTLGIRQLPPRLVDS